MSATLGGLRTDLESRFNQQDPQFRFLVLAEDLAARAHAIHLYDHLTRNISVGCDLAAFLWNPDRPLALESLLEAIMKADLIIVAGNQNAVLPIELKYSLHVGLLMRSRKGGALVALLGRWSLLDAPPSALHKQLKICAHDANLDYFPGAYLAGNRSSACVLDSVREQPLQPAHHLPRG